MDEYDVKEARYEEGREAGFESGLGAGRWTVADRVAGDVPR